MAPDEFDQWIEHHTALFPSMIGWLSKLTDDQQRATLAAWSRLLVGVSLPAATAASDRMVLSDVVPRYERHPASIARLAKREDEQKAKAVATAKFGSGTVACRDCDDLGRLSVYLVGHALARWIEHARRFGSLRPASHATGLVRCDCAAGSDMGHLPRLDRERHTVAIGHPAIHIMSVPALEWQRAKEVDEAEARLEAV